MTVINSSDREKLDKIKKPYIKAKIAKVYLVAQEAVLATCHDNKGLEIGPGNISGCTIIPCEDIVS